MGIKSKSSLTPGEVDEIKQDLLTKIEALEDELGDEETPGTICYRLKQLES